MLTAYITAALQHAVLEELPDGEGWVGTIPGLDGVLAYGATKQAAQDELPSVLEDWLLLGLRFGDPIPIIDGIDLNVPLAVVDDTP